MDRALAATRAAEALFAAGRPVEAVAQLRAATEFAPEQPAVWRNLALALEQEADFTGALAAYRQALAGAPADAGLRRAAEMARSRAGYFARLLEESVALSRQWRLDEAEARTTTALRLAPRSVVARGNLAAMLMLRGRVAEAAAAFEAALAGAGDSLDRERMRAQAGLAWLALGDFARGFAAFEARWSLPEYRDVLAGLGAPRWTGAESLAGRRLLLVAEQGFGDTLQCVRFAEACAARGATVTLRAPRPLLRLLATAPGVARVAAEDAPAPAADFVCPLMSLPLALGVTRADLPGRVPYLGAEPARVAFWRARLAALPARRVGLVWAGGTHEGDEDAMAMDRRRSLDPALLAPLAEVPGVSLVSLQKDAAAPGMADWTAELTDFAETAALVEALDLVIAVDTAVAHLAGALGRPVWLLNRFDSDWRWAQGRLWYPTLREFRQPVAGDWDAVMKEVKQALF